jgi:hypothetical protein
MKEYKIIKQKFRWKASQKVFEDDINNYAKQGWRVVNIYVINNQTNALIERDKNR